MNTANLPLAIDLDGTLISEDVTVRSLTAFALRAPWNALHIMGWCLRSWANAKAHIAKRTPIDPATLTYNQALLTWLTEEKARGRQLVLATASDHTYANSIANHLGLFDAIFASEGRQNLKGPNKAAALRAAFPDGFAYAGNSRADLPVWAASRSIIIVSAGQSVASAARKLGPVEREFARLDGAASRSA